MRAPRPILYVSRFVPGYRVPVLERLNVRLEGRLVVCSGQAPGVQSGYSVGALETSYQKVELKNRWIAGEKIHLQEVSAVFRNHAHPGVVVIEESPRTITLPVLVRHARRQKAALAMWGHFSSNRRPFRPERNLLDRYRLTLAKSADACICYTDGIRDKLAPHIANEDLFVARNTIDIAPLLNQQAQLKGEGKLQVRKRLGLPVDRPVLAFLGRLVPEKGIHELLEAFSTFIAHEPAHLLIVGEGPERTRLEETVTRKNISGVQFLGPLFNPEVGPYLHASDVMVIPNGLGLVINHAFAFGLPIVSVDSRNRDTAHGPEFEYLVHGENARLSSSSQPRELTAEINAVLDDQERYSERALSCATDRLGIEQMVEGLVRAITHAEGKQSR